MNSQVLLSSKQIQEKIRTNEKQYALKITKILRVASLGSKFTGSYKGVYSNASQYSGAIKENYYKLTDCQIHHLLKLQGIH